MSALADREILELLQDRPDLLAVADAIAVTQPHRRSMPRIVVAPVVVAAAAVVLLLLAPWQSHGPSIVDRARAAVGGGPVIHAVVEYSWPQDVVVNLASGAERERVHRQELWYDEERGDLRDRLSADGAAPVDYLVHDGVPERLDPALTGFTTEYRDALADGRARVVADLQVDGRPAKRIEFAPRNGGAVEQVDVDARTLVPLRFRETYPPNGRRSPVFHVVTIESVPRDPSDFTLPKSPPRADSGEVSAERAVSPVEAERALGAPPLQLAGQTADSVALSDTKAYLTDGTTISGVLVRFVYGDVRVALARDTAGSYAIGFGEGEFPTPPAGSVAVTGNNADGWQGELHQGGFAVMVSAPTKRQLVAAARALTPER
jgi:hypothetical protein